MPPATARRLFFPSVRSAVWEEVPLPKPSELQPDQVLLRTVSTAISAGTELATYSGTHINYRFAERSGMRVPSRPGYAFAGTVEAVGKSVRTVKPGDRVGCSVGHAEWAVVEEQGIETAPSPQRKSLAVIPDEVTFQQAALAHLCAIPMVGVRHARIRLGERVAIFGQGLIGQFSQQLATVNGAGATIAVDLWDHRLEVAQKHGATHVVNAAREDVWEALTALTDGHGADVVLEATGNPAVINDALKAAARRGRVMLIGSPRGPVEIDPYSDIHRPGVTVMGAHEGNAGQPGSDTDRWTLLENYRLTLELLRQKRIKTEDLITHRIPADEALQIHDALADRPEEHLGVVIDWR